MRPGVARDELLGLFEQRDGVGADGFAAPDGIQGFAAFGLHIHATGRDPERRGDILLHPGDEAGKPRPFESHRRVHVRDGVARPAEKFADVSEKDEAGSVGPARRGIGEMVADVTQGRGAQQRVANRVAQCVTVRMPDRPPVEGDVDPAQHELSPRSQTMQIVADADAVAEVETFPAAHAAPRPPRLSLASLFPVQRKLSPRSAISRS